MTRTSQRAPKNSRFVSAGVAGFIVVMLVGCHSGVAAGPVLPPVTSATWAEVVGPVGLAPVDDGIARGLPPQFNVSGHHPGDQPGLGKPSPRLTPGARVDVSLELVCSKGYTASVRDVSLATKTQVYTEYGDPWNGNYVVDHLVPLELGGANDIANLWAQPTFDGGDKAKDQVENRLHGEVCSRKLGLVTAQEWITRWWEHEDG